MQSIDIDETKIMIAMKLYTFLSNAMYLGISPPFLYSAIVI